MLKQQNKDLPEKQAELAALQTKIPQAPDLAGLHPRDAGHRPAVRCRVHLTDAGQRLSPSVARRHDRARALPPEALAAINVDMVVTGGYFEITKFMNELETASQVHAWSAATRSAEERHRRGESRPRRCRRPDGDDQRPHLPGALDS